MSNLKCQMCTQLSQEPRMEPAAGLLQQNDLSLVPNPAYVYCIQCKQYICKPCDYKIHMKAHLSDDEELHDKRPYMLLGEKSDFQQPKIKSLSFNQNLQQEKDIQENSKDSPVCAQDQATQAKEELCTEEKPGNSAQHHQRIQICEECAKRQSSSFCLKCEQALCKVCWGKIHNRGARVRHQPVSLQKPKFYPPHTWCNTSLVNQQSVTSSSQHDSLSQYKNEQAEKPIYDDIQILTPRLGSLQVQLTEKGLTQAAVEMQTPQTANSQYSMTTSVGQHTYVPAPPQQHYMHYSVPPSLIPHRQAMQSQEILPPKNLMQMYAAQQPHQMIANSEPFHPGMHYPQQQVFMKPQYTHPYQNQQYFMPPQYNASIQYGQPYLGKTQESMRVVYPAVYEHQYRKPEFYKEKNQLSEEDCRSTGINDEAQIREPSAFLELDQDVPQHAAFRHNLNSEPRIDERATLANQNFDFQVDSDRFIDQTAIQIKGKASHLPTDFQLGAKTFTPLRKQQQRTGDFLTSPLISTPNEQQRNNGFKTSKLLTPPLNVAGQNRATFKTKSGASTSAYYDSKQKPLKVPRDQRTNNNGQGNSMQQAHQAHKPPKGPHIEYQIKTNKPNSMSSHEMNSDYSGENFTNTHPKQFYDQKPFDAYQIDHQQSYSAKNNLRQARKMPSSYQARESRDCSPDYQLSLLGPYSGARDTIVYDEGNQRQGRKIGTRIVDQSLGNSSYYEKREYKLKGTEMLRQVNSSTGIRNNESRGSASKSGSLQNYKSGSGGNQSMSGVQNQKSSGNKTNQEDNYMQYVPIMQPVIQLERKKGPRRADEESKFDENELIRKMQLILFENAAQGELLILKTKFIEQIQEKIAIQRGLALKVIKKSVEQGIIHQTDRNFANSQKIEFISLKIQVFSHQCLQWVITSLRRDEMTPSESAIKNRTKEAFDFKLTNEQWEAVMKSITKMKTPALERTQNEMVHVQTASNVTHPDMGSSVLTPQPKYFASGGESSHTQSSAGSAQQQRVITTRADSEQGITRIMQQSVMTEADTGSGSASQNISVAQAFIEATVPSDQPTGSYQTGLENTISNPINTSSNDTNQMEGPSQSSNSNDPNQPRFKVVQLPSEDDSNSSASPGLFAIYMEDEEVWTGVDIEDDTTVDRGLYQEMKEFLRDYFCAEDQNPSSFESLTSEEIKLVGNDDYNSDLRMIPGGRYGCTQFLKICGPESIRKCSVGKTTQMVQLAIKEDVLRHLKTQIVWSTQVDKHKTEQDTFEDQQILVQRKAKLEKVKEAIIEILAASKTGISLAQLPQYLKKKLPFNLEWNELGFPKLKDLLKSMTDRIKVELRDVNHPFAFLVHKQRNQTSQNQTQINSLLKPMFRDKNLSEQIQDKSARQMVYCSEKLSQIVQAVFTLFQMDPQGVSGTDFKRRVQDQVGFEFSLQELGCSSEYEFISRYIMPVDDSIEFVTMKGQGTFNIRSQKILSNYIISSMAEQKQEEIILRGQKNAYQKEQKFGNNTIFLSSLSHNSFNRGPQIDKSSNFQNQSDISDDQLVNQRHQQNFQTQPDDHHHTHMQLTFEKDYIPTCESIYGGYDTHSESSSLINQISELDLDLQKSTAAPFTQKTRQQMPTENLVGWKPQIMQDRQRPPLHMQPHLNPWYQPPKFSGQPNQVNQGQLYMGHQGFDQIFDNLKINQNLHGGMAHTGPYGISQFLPSGLSYAMPIDQMDQEDDQHSPQRPQPQHASYQMLHPHNYGDNDSPRLQETMSHLLEDSPGENQLAQRGVHQQNVYDPFETQYSRSEGMLNQSIFSDNFNEPQKILQGEKHPQSHKSLDFNSGLESKKEKSTQDQFSQLLPNNQQQDDKTSLNSWHPVSKEPIRLDMNMKTKKSMSIMIPNRDQQPRITEETSDSQYSTPELIEGQLQSE